MGIPHLSATLEPFAIPAVIDNDSVVIDGPAFAYHVLYICRSHGLHFPSYRLLGRVACRWLDDLTQRKVVVQHIFFDASLPQAKLETRRSRLVRSTSMLRRVFQSNAQKFPDHYVTSKDNELPPNLPDPGEYTSTYLLNPPFLVPAIIEALRSSRYSKVTHLVPGEADTFCAGYSTEHGGIVFTSDSDLLVYAMNRGQVAFFRDIRTYGGSAVHYLNYSSLQICHQLGMVSHESPLRLAYERKLAPRLATSQLVKRCARSVSDVAAYEAFCLAYKVHTYPEDTKTSLTHNLNIDSWDPRVSEFILGFRLHCATGRPGDVVNMFLPFMIEQPCLKSAWEASKSIRELAYSVLIWCSSSKMPVVFREYRHMQNINDRGRQACIISQQTGHVIVNDILAAISLTESFCSRNDDVFWIFVCLVLDSANNDTKNQPPQLCSTLREALSGSYLSWEAVHLVSNLQARLYSLRILDQLLSTCVNSQALVQIPGIQDLQSALSLLPLLSQYPDILTLKEAVNSVPYMGFLQCLEDMPREQSDLSDQGKNEGTGGVSQKNTATHFTNNIFNVLDTR